MSEEKADYPQLTLEQVLAENEQLKADLAKARADLQIVTSHYTAVCQALSSIGGMANSTLVGRPMPQVRQS